MTPNTPAPGDAAGWRAFTASVAARVSDRDPLDVQAELVPALRAALAGVAPADLRRPEAPGRWSVAAVLEHLADAELVFGFRLRQMLTRDAPPLEPFDQDAWAARGDYAAGDPEEALATLALLRARHLRLWRGLGAADWTRVGVHGDRGPETLRDLARIVAGHDLAHRAQVARIVAAGAAPAAADRVTPTLPSRDLAATAAFYARLGFREVFRDAGWLIVARGPLQLEFFPHPGLDPWTNDGGCCLRVADAAALHDAFGAAGLPVDPRAIPRLTPPQDQPWGFREFALVDADGNLLRGLQPLAR